MEFNNFLSAYYPDPKYGGDRLFADMLAEAKLAEKLGFRGVAIPEHHLINILLIPDPLQFAVKLAAETKKLELITSVSVLPIHDMRIFAGQVVQADILCNQRLILGIGRGAFAFELARLGVPLDITREKFDESLEVLAALLAGEEVSWKGKYYNFDPLTVMPRPVRNIPMMIAAVIPEAISASVKRGYHIQTTPLNSSIEKMREQTGAFRHARRELGPGGEHLRLALSRVCIVARNDADARRKLELAYTYYNRFENIFIGPGQVNHGCIADIPQKQTIEQLAENLIICTKQEMIDRLGVYAEEGIDDLIVNVNVGLPIEEALEAIQWLGEDVLPHFTMMRKKPLRVAERV